MRAEADRVASRVRELLGDLGGGQDDAVPHPPGPPVDEPTLWARLVSRLPLRVDPGRRTVAVVGVVVLVVALASGAWLLAERPRAMAVDAAGGRSAPAQVLRSPAASGAAAGSSNGGSAPISSAAASTVASGTVAVVDVAGKVRHPGLYRLPAGARVDDAIRAAGGALPGVALTSLNLAARVVDGQQIPVGVAAAAAAPGATDGSAGGAGAGAGSSAAGAPVDLNTADLDQLQTLPGVGPVLGQHILDWRTAHGSFTSVGQLDDVPGIGPTKFAALKPVVTV